MRDLYEELTPGMDILNFNVSDVIDAMKSLAERGFTPNQIILTKKVLNDNPQLKGGKFLGRDVIEGGTCKVADGEISVDIEWTG
ncbi:hypothetical protein LCGC14_0145890 [marine sediment metagenome]|uniref:Uncharacterized protein n=1 Tax=marine sediment metagenome TaxID=412755 RepID=A0A0F9Y1C9_9ZZZZ